MNEIIEYFIEEKTTTEVVAKILAKSLLKYDDIKNEFVYWLENRNFDCPNPIVIEGYTAASIAKIAPHLDASGIYNFMVTLRDEPSKAKEYIEKGFPRK